MVSLIHSKKFYFSLVLIVLGLWLVNSFIPTDSCTQTWEGVVYWGSCDVMSSFVNVLYIAFQSVTLLATIFLIVQTFILFRKKFL